VLNAERAMNCASANKNSSYSGGCCNNDESDLLPSAGEVNESVDDA
jgi:hypothetical protein